MATILGADVLQDDVAVSLARVVAAANRRARELKIDVEQCLITVTQVLDDGLFWRINYGPKDYIGRRGGDLVIDVDADASVKRVLRGQ